MSRKRRGHGDDPFGALAAMPLEPEAFVAWLNRRMKRRAMSNRALAVFAGLDHSAISRIRRGVTRPTFDSAIRLAKALQRGNW